MFAITALWNAITTLAGNVQALAQTVADANAGLRARLQLDHAEGVQVLEHQVEASAVPIAVSSKRGRKEK